MKRFILAIAILLIPGTAWAQCTGVFPPNTLCGNLSGTSQPPAAFSSAGTVVGPSIATSGHIVTFVSSASVIDNPTITTSQNLLFQGLTQISSAFTVTSTTSFTATVSFTGLTNFTSQFQINGNRIQFPLGPDTVGGLGTSQFWTSTNTFSSLTSLATVSLGASVSTAVPLSVSIGGTGVTSIPAHSLLIGETTTATSNTTPGTLGQCVTSNGASADPTFASGCWTLLSSTTATSGAASISDSTHITASYNEYELSIANCLPVANSVTLLLLDTANGGVATSNYIDNAVDITTAGSVGAVTSASAIPLTGTAVLITNGGVGWGGNLRLTPTGGVNQRRWNGMGSYETAGSTISMIVTGYLSVAAVVTGYQLQFTSGNIQSCVAKLYGKL